MSNKAATARLKIKLAEIAAKAHMFKLLPIVGDLSGIEQFVDQAHKALNDAAGVILVNQKARGKEFPTDTQIDETINEITKGK
jgi:hypothetical protein